LRLGTLQQPVALSPRYPPLLSRKGETFSMGLPGQQLHLQGIDALSGLSCSGSGHKQSASKQCHGSFERVGFRFTFNH